MNTVIAILIEKDARRVLINNDNDNVKGVYFTGQPDGQIIMHGQSQAIKAMLFNTLEMMKERKANGTRLDNVTTEYYTKTITALDSALRKVEAILTSKQVA